MSDAFRRGAAGAGAIVLALAAGPGQAQQSGGPAVSQINGKAAIEGGVDGGRGTDYAAGAFVSSITAPLGHAFGVQLDASGGRMNGGGAVGAALHLFTRDPSMFLLGAIGNYDRIRGTDTTRIGGEGALYLGAVTLQGMAGWQWGEAGRKLTTKDSVFGTAAVVFYPIDDLAFTGGAGTSSNKFFGYGQIEWQPRSLLGVPGLALYANGSAGEDDAYTFRLGVRLYFGADKTLKLRHRQDDPPNLPLNGATGGGGGATTTQPQLGGGCGNDCIK